MVGIVGIVLSLPVACLVGYLLVRYGAAETKTKKKQRDGTVITVEELHLHDLLTYTVAGSALATAAVCYLMGWNIYEGLGDGIVSGLFAAGGLKILHDKAMRKVEKRRQHAKQAQKEASGPRVARPPDPPIEPVVVGASSCGVCKEFRPIKGDPINGVCNARQPYKVYARSNKYCPLRDETPLRDDQA
jgi:hypothetical protein